MEAHPELVKVWFEALAPVPRSLLDADTRTAAAFEMWSERGRLIDQARRARTVVGLATEVLNAARPDWTR